MVNSANPQVSVKPSLYGIAKSDDMVTLSVVGAAGSREKDLKRPFLGARFYGGVIVGMGVFALSGLIWMGVNDSSDAPVASPIPVKLPVAKVSQTVEVKKNKSNIVASAATASRVELVNAPVTNHVEIESQPSVTAVLGPITSTAPRKQDYSTTAPEKSVKALVKEAKKESMQTSAPKRVKSDELVVSQSKTAPPRKRDPDVDLIEAVISRIGHR